MELRKSGQDLLGSNVLDSHKWDKYCLDDSFLSHTSVAGFPVEDVAGFPGDGERRVMTSLAWPKGTGVLFWLVFFFSTLYLFHFGTRGDGEEKHGRTTRTTLSLSRKCTLCFCTDAAQTWRKASSTGLTFLHTNMIFILGTEQHIKSAMKGVFKLWRQAI